MKKYLFLLNLTFIIFLINHCHHPEIQSRWIEDDVTFDENFLSSKDNSAVYFEDIRASIEFRNSTEYLYIILKTSDVFVSREIKIKGLTAWIDGSNKKRKAYGVRYDGKNRMGMDVQSRDSFWGSLTAEQKQRLELKHKEMQQTITVINDGDEQKIQPHNPEGAAVVELQTGQDYYIGYRLHLKHIKASRTSSPLNRVMLGFEWGRSVEIEKYGRMGPGEGDMEMSGRGNPGGRMMRPGAENKRFLPQDIWLKVILGEHS